jgi:hypothetical protein
VAFLDADDAWLPWKLAAQRAFVAQHPEVVMCCGGRVTMDAQGRMEGGLPPPPAGNLDLPWRVIDRLEMAKRSTVVTSTVLLLRRVFEEVGGFDARFRGPEDYDLWIRIVAAGPAAALEVPLAGYRYRPGSLSMDERRFLPQVLGVLDKAYAAGGGLREVPEWRHASIATQLQQASWMAFCRGARAVAVLHLLRAWGWMMTGRRRMSYPWAALLYRYVFGKRPTVDAR